MNVCTLCHVALTNDDWSGHYDGATTEKEYAEREASLAATVECIRADSIGEEYNFDGYFTCFICDDISVDQGFIYSDR